MDEWIYFLKNSEIKEGFTAKGLPQAKEKLDEMKMSDAKRKEYQQYLKRLRDIASEQHTKMADTEDLIKERLAKRDKELVRRMKEEGLYMIMIQKITGLSKSEIENL